MPGPLLTSGSTVLCPHGGQATLITSNSKVLADGQPVLLENDIHPVVGCPLIIILKPSPCIRIEWTAGTTKMSVDGTPALVMTSVGKCINAEGGTQGVGIVANTQFKASAK